LDPVVSARIQHGLFEGNDGFRPARVRFRAWFGRTPRRHRDPAAALRAEYSTTGSTDRALRPVPPITVAARAEPGHDPSA
jgi:hypothetical protein